MLSFDAEPVSEDLNCLLTDGKRKNVFVFSGPDKNQWVSETRQYIDSCIQACGHVTSGAAHVETARSTQTRRTVMRGMTTVTQTSSYQTGNGQVYSTTTTSTSASDGYDDPSQVLANPEGYLARIQFNYTSLDGGVTPCLVSVSNVSAVRFEGYCHMMQTERSFLIARVAGAVLDQETGERTRADFFFADLLLRMPMLLAKRTMPRMAEVREAMQERAQEREEIKNLAARAGFSSCGKED